MRTRLRLSTLYLEELRGLPRARFALAGSAVFAAALMALAAVVIPSPLGLWSFALLVYGAGPVLIGAFAALHMADLRASRLTDSLYTLPVRSGTVLGAHVWLGLTVAAAYLVATLPFLGVAALHIAVPMSVLRLLLGGAFLMVFAVALGTLIGVLFTGRSVAAPVGLTTAILFVSMLAIPPNASLQLDGALQGSLLMRALHISPYVLVSDGLGLLGPSVAAASRSPLLALSLVALQIVAMFAVAAWVLVREQGPERWESGPTRRIALVTLTMLVLLAVPFAVADDAYAPLEGRQNDRYGSSSQTDGAWLAVVPRGTPVGDADFGDHRSGTTAHPLDATAANARDLLIRLPLEPSSTLTDVRATFESDRYLIVSPTRYDVQAPAPEHDGRGVVLRVPVLLTPLDPQDLTGNTYQLWTNVTYTADGTEQTGRVESALEAEVPWAVLRLAGAGAPLFLVAAGGAIRRRLRVG